MDEGKHWDSVGWVFWFVMLAIFSGPFIYWAWQQKYESTPWATPIILGLIGGAIVAGVVSSAVNGVLQYRARHRHLEIRKVSKKKRKKS
jgi:uncharacterized protein (DUF2062 family)